MSRHDHWHANTFSITTRSALQHVHRAVFERSVALFYPLPHVHAHVHAHVHVHVTCPLLTRCEHFYTGTIKSERRDVRVSA